MANALHEKTSDLPLVRRGQSGACDGLGMFASNTRGAIHCGAMNAVTGAIERAHRTLRAGKYRPQVVLTGGDASRILQALDGKPVHRPHLVLQGLLHMLSADSTNR